MKTIFSSLAGLSLAKVSTAPYFFNETRPLVLGHRGSTGFFPEHSEASYSSAYTENVDFVELDLQITKDGHFVTNHDPCLKLSTNIELYADKYADRKGTFYFDLPYAATLKDDWLIHDFTLEELKELRRTQRYEFRN